MAKMELKIPNNDRSMLTAPIRFFDLFPGAATLTATLGRCSARISCRTKNGVTITFYQLQKGCDHHVLSAADQHERPSAVKTWSYLHVL